MRDDHNIIDEINEMIGRLSAKNFHIPPGKVELNLLKNGFYRVDISFKARREDPAPKSEEQGE